MRVLDTTTRIVAVWFCAALLASAPAFAQDGLFADEPAAAERSAAYSAAAGRLTPTQIIQEKAQVRAAQRMSRIAAKEWFGYSPARPRTDATPFTGMYGPHFQGRALGRPAAFHVARPIVVVR